MIMALTLLLACDNFKQNNKPLVLSLDLKELNYWWQHPVIKQVIKEKLSDTSNIRFYLTDYKGALTFEVYNQKNKLIQKGAYINALAVFKQYVAFINKSTGDIKMTVEDYYQPLPDGVWIYYSNEKIIKQQRYNQGNVILH